MKMTYIGSTKNLDMQFCLLQLIMLAMRGSIVTTSEIEVGQI